MHEYPNEIFYDSLSPFFLRRLIGLTMIRQTALDVVTIIRVLDIVGIIFYPSYKKLVCRCERVPAQDLLCCCCFPPKWHISITATAAYTDIAFYAIFMFFNSAVELTDLLFE